MNRKVCVAPMMGYTTPYARNLYRILSKNGEFLFAVPLDVPYHGYPRDYWRFSGPDVNEMLEKNNFKIIKLEKIGKDREILLDKRLNFYNQRVNNGPYGYVALAKK